MEKNYKIYNVIILDESGSMQSIKSYTIKGFNEVLETIQAAGNQNPDHEHFVTFVTFNTSGIKTQLFNEPAQKLKPLTAGNFLPNACTPLFDAMGSCLTKQRDSIANQENVEVLVTILTDGYENASVEYNHKAIKNLIAELKSLGWTITYMGANHDVEKFTMEIGIEHKLQFESNMQDMDAKFSNEKNSRMAFYHKAGMVDKGKYFVDEVKKEDEKNDKKA